MDWNKLDLVKDDPLPDYVVADVNNLAAIENSTIRTKAAPLSFPLSDEDRRDIFLLITKFKKEKLIAGLAAPQIGISKRVIVFEVPNTYAGERPFPFSVWINPSFEKVHDRKDIEFEECFSVKGFTGPVERWTTVSYKAHNLEGQLVEGLAKGVAARVIQHETDHLDGILFIDLVPKGSLMPSEEYHRLVRKMENVHK